MWILENKVSVYFLSLFLLIHCLLFPEPAYSSDYEVAIIVNPSHEMNDVTSNELDRIFRLNRQRWGNGQKIYLIMQEEGSHAKQLVLRKVYRMTSDELKRLWLAKIYRGELTSFPKTLHSNESVRRFVARVPNAIGFIDASAADGTVKVLRINGKRPGEEGYVLGLDRN